MFLFILPPVPPGHALPVQATPDIRLPNGNRIGIVRQNADGSTTVSKPNGNPVDRIITRPDGRIEHRDPASGNLRYYEQRKP